MKWTLLLVVWLMSAPAVQAEPVGISFRDQKVVSFIDAVLRGILKRDYVVSPDVAKLDGVVTVSLKSIERDRVLDVVRSSLSSLGVVVVERDGLLFVERGRAGQEPVAIPYQPGAADIVSPEKPAVDVGVYFPKHRTPEMLSMAVKVAGATVPELKGDDKQGKRDAVVYAGPPEVLAKVARLLAELDRPSSVVNVRAVLLEVSESSESARSIAAVFNLLRGKLGIQYSAGQQHANFLSLSGASIDAVLSIVDGDSRFKYLSEPSLRVIDGETARLVVGADVPVRGAATVDRNGMTVQSIDYRTAGVVISIEPRVLERSILLKIGQQISNFQTTTTSGIDSPTMQKREAQTVVDIAEGELLVLAGLDETRDARTSSGLSWLPSFLRSKSDNQSRSQILLMLEVQREKARGI